METTPRDGDIIGVTLIIEVTIATILEVAVVHPDVGCAVKTKVISTITVVCTRTFKGEVTHNDIVRTRLKIEYA